MNRLEGIKFNDEIYWLCGGDIAEDRSDELTARSLMNRIFSAVDVGEFRGRSMPLHIFIKRYATNPAIYKGARTKRRLVEIMLDELSFIGVEPKVIQSDDSEIFITFKVK